MEKSSVWSAIQNPDRKYIVFPGQLVQSLSGHYHRPFLQVCSSQKQNLQPFLDPTIQIQSHEFLYCLLLLQELKLH